MSRRGLTAFRTAILDAKPIVALACRRDRTGCGMEMRLVEFYAWPFLRRNVAMLSRLV